MVGGAFLGGFKKGKNGKPTAIQVVNMDHFLKQEAAGGVSAGVLVVHEMLEAYSGVKMDNLVYFGKVQNDEIKKENFYKNLFAPAHNRAIWLDKRFKEIQSPIIEENPWLLIINGNPVDVRINK